jgi:hypothetical protein
MSRNFFVDADQCREGPITHVASLIRASMHRIASGLEG